MTAPSAAAAPTPAAADPRRRDRRLLVGALAAVVLIGGVLGAYTLHDPPVRLPLDAESPLPNGALGIFEAAGRLGWRPARAELPLANTNPAATYVAVRAPHGVQAADAGRLLAAVRAGAGLVVDVRPDGDPLSDSLGLRLAAGRIWPLDNVRVAARVGAADALRSHGCRRASVDESDGTEMVGFVLADSGPASASAPGLRVFVDVANRRADSTSTGGVILEGVSNGRYGRPADARDPAPALVGFPLGRGRVVAVADASLFTNAALTTCWAAAGPAVVRALEWVSPVQATPARDGGRGALVFLQGRREVPGGPGDPSALRATWRALTEVPAGRALAQALGAAFVLLAALAARAVPPLPLGRAERRSPREYVGALAHAYREAHATRLVARRLARGLRRRYGGPAAVRRVGAAGVGASAGAGDVGDEDARFLAAIATRHPAASADAARLADATRAAVPPAGLAAVGEAAARLDATLAAARRGA